MFTKLLCFLCLISSLFGSYTEKFNQCFDVLKRKDWETVIDLGEKALHEQNDPRVHARLASCYFYLSRYDKMKEHIDLCLEQSLDDDSEELLIRSLYLLSAYYRSQEEFPEARRVIAKALSKARRLDNKPLLSKVLFNAGAADSDDPQGNLEYAKVCLEEGLTLLDPNTDDAHRVLIRLGRVYLLTKCTQAATLIVSKLSEETLVPRTQVHFYTFAAKVAQAKNNHEELAKYLSLGIDLAKQLKMQRDVERLESIKEENDDHRQAS